MHWEFLLYNEGIDVRNNYFANVLRFALGEGIKPVANTKGRNLKFNGLRSKHKGKRLCDLAI
ncbi:MAG TPA: hypothetical protein DCR97_00515 [Deltaproteobacteria bacterium]|nr:hypothetical protein [Deltaproteobacteria bacterium]